MIALGCPQCGVKLKVADELAGRSGRCPRCKSPVVIPARVAAASIAGEVTEPSPVVAGGTTAAAAKMTLPAGMTRPPASPPRKTNAASAADPRIDGVIEPIDTSLGYQVAMLVVAVVMVLLLLIYVGLLAGVAALLVWHAVVDTWMLHEMNSRSGRGNVLLLFFYLAPLVAGVIALLFMCKPLFARPQVAARHRALTRAGQPRLFAFVDAICAAVGARSPQSIRVDCHVNASAGFQGGLAGMLRRDMVLTIGLPLAAGLNLQQFAGVLAHEFGHFTQDWGLRLSYLIRSISHWFTRVVYERDAWDAWLEHAAETWTWRGAIVLQFARLLVWCTRKILWCLMMVGHAVSGLLLRQMEFDADMHEIRLSGSACFESTCRRLVMLEVANSLAMNNLHEWYRESRLSDDLPKLIRFNVEMLPAELVTEILRQTEASQTRWLDTHPSNQARILAARQAQAAGLFHDDRETASLFASFGLLCQAVTLDFYQTQVGLDVQPNDLQATDYLLERQAKERQASEALDRFFLQCHHPLRPLALDSGWLADKVDTANTIGMLRNGRARMAAAASAYREHVEALVECEHRLAICENSEALLEAGCKVKAEGPSRPLKSHALVRNERQAVQDRRARLAAACVEFDAAAAARFYAALQALADPVVAARLPNGPRLLKHCRGMLSPVLVIGRQMPRIIELRRSHDAITQLLPFVDASSPNAKLIETIDTRARRMVGQTQEILEHLNRFEYPFKHTRGNRTIARYCTEVDLNNPDFGQIMTAASELLDRLLPLYMRLMGQLAIAAENVEKIYGLEPLKPRS